MRQFLTIATNAFMELARQPVTLLLVTVSAGFEVFLAVVPYFGFGDEPKMVKDSALAVMLLSGLLAAVMSASASLAREIRSGTALTVLSKPVSRLTFLLGKFAGLAAALTVITYINLLAALLASRMAFDAYGGADKLALGLWAAFVVVAYLAGAFSNYFLRRLFTADALFALVGTSTLAFLIINCFDSHGARQEFGKSVDWRLVPAGVLILFALWILAGLALACSTRLEMIPTLAVCSGVFLLGLMSDYLFGRAAGAGSWIASALYTAVPNWQLFWIADAMEGTGPVPGVWSYVAKAFAYVVCYTGAALAAALALFQDRELN